MAIDPATAKLIAKAVISQITDEEKRQRLIIGIVVGIVVFLLILAIPILLLVSAWETIKGWFSWETEEEMKASAEYSTIYQIKQDYGAELESVELVFNGELPMPVNNAVVTSEFGNRTHPVSRKTEFSYRYRFSWCLAHRNIKCFRWKCSVCRCFRWIWELCKNRAYI